MARILTSSDCSLCVEFGDTISKEINRQVRAFTLAVEAAGTQGVTELVPTYRSVTVHYRPEVMGYARLYERLHGLLNGLAAADIPPAETIRVPVLYGGVHGPDLENVAQRHGLTPGQVIELYTAPTYLNYMLGFMPGFCYLGGLDERLHTPRLTTPRVRIPAGSVGIAGSQTGIYPLDSPGGWQLIGQTPLRLYDPKREKAILVDAGMELRFYPIDEREYERLRRENYPEEFVSEGGENP